MELTVSQKIELQLAVAARVKEFEKYDQSDKYVKAVLEENRELLDIIRNTMIVEVTSYSDFSYIPSIKAESEVEVEVLAA